MGLLRALIGNHPLANIAFVVVIVMGLMAYAQMPREQDPEINFNWVNVATALPGASAEASPIRSRTPSATSRTCAGWSAPRARA